MTYMRLKSKPTKHLNRRQVLKCGVCSSLTASLLPSLWLTGCTKKKRTKKPNIILVVIDTLRADHLGCCGYRRNITPNIDSLAADSLLFKNAISPAPWTTPAVAALLTSQYPSVMGMFENVVPINKRFTLFSEVLKQQNYSTYGIISHALLSARLGFERGFDVFDEINALGHEGISSPQITDKAISFLKNKHQQPFFLFAHYFDPHYNYCLHPEYNYYKDYNGKLKSNHSILELWEIRQKFSKDDIEFLLALYDSEIAFTDEYIGRVFGELKKQDLYDNSIIIVTADHGEEFMERGWLGHTITLYQEMLRVPLIMKMPGCKPQVIDPSVGLINVIPTIYRYMDLQVDHKLEGSPLLLDSGKSITAGPIFSETFNPQVHQPGRIQPIALRSIVLGSRKLIYNQVKDSIEIYDFSSDPYEQNNLSAQKNLENDRLKKLLASWIKYAAKKRKPTPIPDETELFTPEQIEQLKSLGYLK